MTERLRDLEEIDQRTKRTGICWARRGRILGTRSRSGWYARQLRQKLGDTPAQPRWITTEPGLGYRWLPETT
jgi:DNA-binding response OmpR family regulator